MPHVDEGALHAYLDGALDDYPNGEARRIRAHLERCASCGAALAEARSLRDTAEAVLATPTLNVTPPPPVTVSEPKKIDEKKAAAEGASSAKALKQRATPVVGAKGR